MNCHAISTKDAIRVFLLLAFVAIAFPVSAQKNVPDIDAILAAAKNREDDGRVNFCGFFIGMSRYDAEALAEHYQLEKDSFNFGDSSSVVSAAFTLSAVRKIVKRGNTFDELRRAVERQVGDMEFDPNLPSIGEMRIAQSLLGADGAEALLESRVNNQRYQRKTIDGDIVRMGEKFGLVIFNNEEPKKQRPVWESDWAKAKSNAAEALAEEKMRVEKGKVDDLWSGKEAKAVSSLIENMLQIPGRDSEMDKSIVMAKYEVTQALWKAVMGENPSQFKGVDLPVENVSWNDCQKFLEKLNAMDEVKKSGLVFRLPTAAEWNYACSAGSRSIGSNGYFCRLADGTDITERSLGRVAWFSDNSEGKTHPVGRKMPNAFGLFDMHGNVWELTSTKFAKDSVASYGGSWRSVRSGCESPSSPFYDDKCHVNCAFDFRWYDIGFRLVADDPKAFEEEMQTVRKLSVASNARVAAVKPVLDKMGIETMVVELPGDVQLLMNKLPDGEWFGAFEVTQAQWMSVTGVMPNPFDGADHPARSLSRSKCDKFLKKLNAMDEVKKSGLAFHLPTEEEWEYACRAGSKGDFCLGPDGKKIRKSTLGDVAWYEKNAASRTHPVGMKLPNAFGLYDVHGNVSEWTTVKSIFLSEVLRGGNYYSDASTCEADCRGSPSAFMANEHLWGFRLAARNEAAQ